MRIQNTKYWSGKVTRQSNALDLEAGVFTWSDPKKIAKLSEGNTLFYEPGLEELLKHDLKSGRLIFTVNYEEVIPQADIIFICVGTPSSETGQADLTITAIDGTTWNYQDDSCGPERCRQAESFAYSLCLAALTGEGLYYLQHVRSIVRPD